MWCRVVQPMQQAAPHEPRSHPSFEACDRIVTRVLPAGVTRGVVKRGVQLLLIGAVMALAMFAPAGRLDWWQAWAFLGIYFGAILFNALIVLPHDPELAAERAERSRASTFASAGRTSRSRSPLQGFS